jgi:hypothetical protein
MLRTLLCSLLVGIVLFGCDKKEDEEYDGPVWILNVTVRDGSFPNRPLPECAHVKWKYEGEVDDRDVGCRNSNDFVKVWEPISEDVRIYYRVSCPGYSDSPEAFADFRYALVDTLPDGKEVIQNVTVTIYSE